MPHPRRASAALARAMLSRGFDEEVVEGILGRNFERVFGQILPG